MIINYAVLSLSENYAEGIEEYTKPICFDFKRNPESVENLMNCKDCDCIVCQCCISKNHENHKISNLNDFLEQEANDLSQNIKNYKELGNKINFLIKKIDFSNGEVEKIIKIEKENILTFFRDSRNLLDKNQEIMLNSLDKILKDFNKKLECFKIENKNFASDSNRYCSIIEELSNYKHSNTNYKLKIHKIYNINSTINEIKQFNKETLVKLDSIYSPENYFKNFKNIVKSCELYRNKMNKILNELYRKQINLIEKGFEKKFNFFSKKNKVIHKIK